MNARDSIFNLFHPVVALAYCGVVLVFSMAVMQPVYLVLNLAGQMALALVLRGRVALRGLLWQAPVVLVLAVANPLFVSVGSTELFRIGLHAFYAEALVFGACQGLMLVNVLLAFSNAACVLSSDKVMAVLGNVAPVVSLMISMTMRLVPQFARRGREVSAVELACTAALSKNDENELRATKGMSRRARAASKLRLTTVLMGWGLEDSLETADAMRARGWGAVRKRTTYRRNRFRAADAVACAVLAATTLVAGLCAAVAVSSFAFYPRIVGIAPWYSYLAYVVLLALPLAAQAWGRAQSLAPFRTEEVKRE